MIVLTSGRFPLLRFDRGELFPRALEEWCAERGVRGGVVVCGIGMLERTDLGVFDGSTYSHRVFDEPAEVLSLQGNLSMRDGAPFAHVHALLGLHDFSAVGGHLFGGTVAVTLEVLFHDTGEDLERARSDGPFRPLETAKS
ncbi:DUF296 domain-containing protein [Candidatus Fermentibacteria bacterium]|nr:DUF296 domain-containing protein [Candidatus Fermentibacteria bacterium]